MLNSIISCASFIDLVYPILHQDKSGLNLGIRMKHYFQALFMFHLHSPVQSSPVSSENQFGPYLGIP